MKHYLELGASDCAQDKCDSFCFLYQVLEDLNCVEKTVFRKPVKSSLFSKPAVTQEGMYV